MAEDDDMDDDDEDDDDDGDDDDDDEDEDGSDDEDQEGDQDQDHEEDEDEDKECHPIAKKPEETPLREPRFGVAFWSDPVPQEVLSTCTFSGHAKLDSESSCVSMSRK